MLVRDFLAHLERGKTTFAPTDNIIDLTASRSGSEDRLEGLKLTIRNESGQLDQLATVLAHDKTALETQLMAALVVLDGGHAGNPPTFNMFRKRLGSTPFRNINHNNSEFFFDSDKKDQQNLRNLLCQKTLAAFGFKFLKATDRPDSPYQKLKSLFACIQLAHHCIINLPVPASGKIFTAKQLHAAIKKLQRYGGYIQSAVSHYKDKGTSKALKQYTIMRSIQEGHRWLLAQYIVVAHSIGAEPSIQFSTDSMKHLLTRPITDWCHDDTVSAALEHLKPSSSTASRGSGHGSAAATAGLMVAPRVTGTDTAAGLLAAGDGDGDGAYDETPLCP
ncbi:MAG: hypothetical protein P1U40_05005 [Coxiellaceae bacterium]|nr:hypothetical protein [Coxiellaceae bacterium]